MTVAAILDRQGDASTCPVLGVVGATVAGEPHEFHVRRHSELSAGPPSLQYRTHSRRRPRSGRSVGHLMAPMVPLSPLTVSWDGYTFAGTQVPRPVPLGPAGIETLCVTEQVTGPVPEHCA